MKKLFFSFLILFLWCTLELQARNMSHHPCCNTQEKANDWLETALLHEPDDVYSGFAPYSDSALGHARDALESGANPNGIWLETGKLYLTGLGLEFTQLLLKFGANPSLHGEEAIKDARERKDHKVLALLLAAQKRLQQERK